MMGPRAGRGGGGGQSGTPALLGGQRETRRGLRAALERPHRGTIALEDPRREEVPTGTMTIATMAPTATVTSAAMMTATERRAGG